MNPRVWRIVVAVAAVLILASSLVDHPAATAALAVLGGFFPAALMALGARPKRWAETWPFLALGALLSGGLLGIWCLHLTPGVSWWWCGWVMLLVLWLIPLVLVSWLFAARFETDTFRDGGPFGKE